MTEHFTYRNHIDATIITALSVVGLLLAACSERPPTKPHSESTDTDIIYNAENDTTSHNYTWETFIFGHPKEGGFWKDICALDDNNAVVVGYVRDRDPDSAKNGKRGVFSPGSAARWNGKSWEPFHVYRKVILSSNQSTPDSIQGRKGRTDFCWGSGAENWTFATGGILSYYDGTTFITDRFTDYFGPSMSILSVASMWGDEDNRWYGGHDGWIVRARGRTYTAELILKNHDIVSIWGNEHEVWATSGHMLGGRHALLYHRNGLWKRLEQSPPEQLTSVNAVWCDRIDSREGGMVVTVGSHIVVSEGNRGWSTARTRGQGPFQCVHGTDRNNVFAAGTQGRVVHFNGSSWKHYPELTHPRVWYKSVWATENRVFLAGSITNTFAGINIPQALITVGTRVE
jgi:hypothetical protein